MDETEKIKSSSQFDVRIIVALSEKEARALQALTVYGTKEFLQCFYKNLGETYLKPHADGIHSLFQTVKAELPKHLDKADKTREIWRTNV